MQGKGIFLLSKMQNIGICDALTHVVLLEQNWSCMVCFSEMNFDILKCFSSELRWNSNMWRAPFLKFHLAKGLVACLVYILDEIYHIIDHLALGLHQPQRPSTCWDSDSWVLSSHYYIIPSVLSTQGQAAPKLGFHLDLGYIPVKFPDCIKTRVGQWGQVWGGHLPDFNLLARTTSIFELAFILISATQLKRQKSVHKQTDI